jgi:thiamine-monophosphate kinase
LLVENVHFNLKTSTPWQLGAKALAASLSDLAAMGAMPRLFLVSLALPKGIKPGFLQSLYGGLTAWGSAFGAELAGGDTSASPGPLVIDIMALGEIEKGRALRRDAARPGDDLYVSGPLGDSAAGLACLRHPRASLEKGVRELLVKRHLLPVPRVLAGRFLVKCRAGRACIDVSDGLASELHHLAEESGVAVDVEADAIPISREARQASSVFKRRALGWALSGGEDYELLFSASKSNRSLLERDFSRLSGAGLHRIGGVKKGRGVRLRLQGRWKPLPNVGYEHQF